MNMSEPLKLHWEPLQHFEQLGAVDKKHLDTIRSGLYIWGFIDDKNLFWPYYAGKHRNVPFRLCEHLSNLKGGNYTIYAPDDLFSEEDNRFYEPHILSHRVEFIKKTFSKGTIAGHVENMIKRFHFTYCLLNNFKADGDAAEQTVLNCFSKNLLINTRFGVSSGLIDVGNLFAVISGKWDNRDK